MNRESERKRLVELVSKIQCRNSECAKSCSDCASIAIFDEDVELLADHLLANGIVVPPVKVGQTVYALVIEKIEEFVVVSVEFSRASGFSLMASNGKYPMLYNDKDIGKTVFFTREEAEKMLEGEEK